MKELLIIGAGGFGKEVAWLAERINRVNKEWNVLGFLDDNENLTGNQIYNYRVLGNVDAVIKYPEAYIICAVGSSVVKEKIINKILNINPNANFATLIDPSVIISDSSKIGVGTVICASSIVSVDTTIGDHVAVNLDCTIGHDAVLNDYVTVYPSVNVSGGVEVGKCSELGTGTQIIQYKTIGCCSVVGAGSVVLKDVPDNVTAVGNPARVMIKRD